MQSLLLSRDPQTIRILRSALEKMSIDVEVCRGARSGSEILSEERFDAVIIDCDDLQGGLDVISEVRKGHSNRSSVTFALLNGTATQTAFELGANFVLQKPISTTNAIRCFSAALGLMEREQRRYFRYPIQFEVTATFRQGEELKATATNLSEGGMALHFEQSLPKAGLSKVAFRLPGGQISMDPKATLVWMDGLGRAGVRFLEMPKSSRDALERWLRQQIENTEAPAPPVR